MSDTDNTLHDIEIGNVETSDQLLNNQEFKKEIISPLYHNYPSFINRNISGNCVICTKEMNDVCILRCNHILCLECFMNWFKNNKSCPFCRENINDLNLYFDEELNRSINNNHVNNSLFNKCSKIICYVSIVFWSSFIIDKFI